MLVGCFPVLIVPMTLLVAVLTIKTSEPPSLVTARRLADCDPVRIRRDDDGAEPSGPACAKACRARTKHKVPGRSSLPVGP